MGHGSLTVVLLAAIPGLMKFDLLYWWAGRLWGERIILLLSGRRKHGPRFMARVQRWGWKFTWPAVVVTPFLPMPNAIVYATAGWAGMSWVTFLVLDAIGSLLWAGMLAGLGYALGQHAVDGGADRLPVRSVGIDRDRRPYRGRDKCAAVGCTVSCTIRMNVHLALQLHGLLGQDVYPRQSPG